MINRGAKAASAPAAIPRLIILGRKPLTMAVKIMQNRVAKLVVCIRAFLPKISENIRVRNMKVDPSTVIIDLL